ncbi:MAG: hypothetical protein HOQ45_11930 [Nocardioidaceae bacterium]|nr:hypothetical protein [Nocardioidaceae bacterium]
MVVVITCHTAGCCNEGLPISVQTDGPVDFAVCGGCEAIVADVTQTPDPAPGGAA